MTFRWNSNKAVAAFSILAIIAQTVWLQLIAFHYRSGPINLPDFTVPAVLLLAALASGAPRPRWLGTLRLPLTLASIGGLGCIAVQAFQGTNRYLDVCQFPVSGPAGYLTNLALILPCLVCCMFPLPRSALTTIAGFLEAAARLTFCFVGMLVGEACLDFLSPESGLPPMQAHWAMVLGMAVGGAAGLRAASVVRSLYRKPARDRLAGSSTQRPQTVRAFP